MSINERAFIRTIVKWSKPATFLVVAIVLLAAGVFAYSVKTDAMTQVSQSHAEVRKTKSNLETVKTEKNEIKATLGSEVTQKDARIHQLEQENAELKG